MLGHSHQTHQESNQKLLLVDGSSVLVRAFFASSFHGTIRRSTAGVYTNAVLGFCNMLISAIEQIEPTHVLVAWDVSRDTFRRKLYPAYKGTRGELPDELHPQFDTAKDVLQALGIHQHLDESYEADDIIGTMAHRAGQAGMKAVIVTGDRDALQLITATTTVAIMRKGVSEMDWYTPELLAERTGLEPRQIIDLKGLMGDTSDNIPGIPGVGEKTATKLLKEFGNLEELLSRTTELTGKLREKVETHADLALLSKQLATICIDVPMPHEVSDCRLQVDIQTGAAKLDELDLSRIAAQLHRLVAG